MQMTGGALRFPLAQFPHKARPLSNLFENNIGRSPEKCTRVQLMQNACKNLRSALSPSWQRKYILNANVCLLLNCENEKLALTNYS